METLQTMKSLGLTLPTPAYIFGAIFFGILGLVAWRVGRQRDRPITLWLGVAMMVYPYVVSSTLLLYAIGIALAFGAWRAARD